MVWLGCTAAFWATARPAAESTTGLDPACPTHMEEASNP